MQETDAIKKVVAILAVHPALNLAALRVWSDAAEHPTPPAFLRSGFYGSYSALYPRIKYLKANGFLEQRGGYLRATDKKLGVV